MFSRSRRSLLDTVLQSSVSRNDTKNPIAYQIFLKKEEEKEILRWKFPGVSDYFMHLIAALDRFSDWIYSVKAKFKSDFRVRKICSMPW